MDLEQAILALKTRQERLAIDGLRTARRGDTFEYGVLAGRVDEIDKVIELLVVVNRGDDPNAAPVATPMKPVKNPYTDL